MLVTVSMMNWEPLNLTEACPPQSHLTACTNFGYIYLNLLVQIYGGSIDTRIQNQLRRNEQTRFDAAARIVEDIEGYGYKTRRKDSEEYDFIVVGAGSAGCIVANRLSEEKKWKVLLLEAGPEQPDVTVVPGLSTALIGSNIDWQYRTQPDGRSCLAFGKNGCAWPRGKTMGGSSSINSLVYIRGNRVDYDGWAALGNEGWSYRDVLPYFQKSEYNLNFEALDRKYHGVNGEQYVSRLPYIDTPSLMLTRAFNEKGLPLIDYNGAQQFGTMQAQNVAKDGLRVSANAGFIRPIRYKRKNLIIRTESEVIKVLVNEHKRAFGVQYIRNGKIETVLAKKEVIVSAGAINAPKLLMLSGIGPKEHLKNVNIKVIENLAVGENLHDHVTFNGVVIALPNETATTVSKREILQSVVDYAKLYEKKYSPLSGNGPVSSVAFFKTSPDLPAPDIQYQVNNVNWREYIRQPAAYDGITIFPTAFYDGLTPRTMNLVPKSRGKLFLNGSNPYGEPIIYANYFKDESDLYLLLKGVRFLLTLEYTEAFRTRGAYFVKIPLPACRHFKWGTDEYFACLARSYTSTTYHPVGTCKMGPTWDNKAVVDPRLRVYGISGLRVIDSSIMPVVIRGNTNAPSLMIGERGVALVKEDWLKNYTQ